MKAIGLFFRFAWLLCVFVPLPVMGQVGNAADGGAVTPDQPVKPAPSLRLLASEPDLASLPRAPLATAADRPAARSTQASPIPDEARSAPAPETDDLLSPDRVQQRIASLPTVPATSPPAPAPRQASARAAPLPDIAKALTINLSAPWLRMAGIGLLVVAVAGLFWRLGKRSRRLPAIVDTAPIDWAIAADSKDGLGKMLRAEREKAAQQARASQQRARFASLGEALTAMKADMQRSATRRRPRALDA